MATRKKTTAVADYNERPDFMKDRTSAGVGFEHVTSEDLVTPRVKLLQGQSPEVIDGMDGAKPGQFWSTVMEKPLGDEIIIVCAYHDKRYFLFDPDPQNFGRILARADDSVNWNPANTEFEVKIDKKTSVVWKTADTVAASGLAEWGTSDPDDPDSPPAATLLHNFICTFPDHPELGAALISLGRSQLKKAKDLLSKLRSGGPTSNIFDMRIRMRAVTEASDYGEYYGHAFERAGWVQTEEEIEASALLHDQFTKLRPAISDDSVSRAQVEDQSTDDDEVPY